MYNYSLSSFKCLVSDTSSSLSFYLNNYSCSIKINTSILGRKVRKELEHDYANLLCRKLITVERNEDYETYIKNGKVDYTKNKQKHQTKHKVNILKVNTLTATFLDWWLCSYLTDSTTSFVGNFWMKMYNGNRIKDQLDIYYQNVWAISLS